MAGARIALACACLGLAAAVLPARAQDAPLRGSDPPPEAAVKVPSLRTMPESLADAIGTWDMALDGSDRRCQVSLSGDSGPDGTQWSGSDS